MSKTINLTKGQFITLSDTQLKVLTAEGYQVVIVDEVSPVVVTKPETTMVVSKTTTKSADKKPTSKTSKSVAPKLKLVVDGYFKVINSTTKVVDFAGKVKKFEGKGNDKLVVATNGKKFKVSYCTAISEKEFGKLKKSLGKGSKTKAPKATRIEPNLWTRLLAILAHSMKPEAGFYEFAKYYKTLTDKDCADVNAQIKSECPDLKLNISIANKLLDILSKDPEIAPSQLFDAYKELSK